jgi:hypothetical protein
MKVRKGFVSNSSSSSFVVVGDKEIKFKHLCKTADDLRNYYIDWCGEEELEEYYKEEFEERKKLIEEGKVLLLGSCSFGGEVDFINMFDDSMEIIWGD